MKDNFVRMASTECPHCHCMHDTASCASAPNKKLRPKPGNVTMCIRCGAILVFTRSMNLRMMTEREYNRASKEERELFAKMALAREMTEPSPSTPRAH